MNNKMKEIYVFGAGFTRAFCPEAPLLIDDYGTYELIDKYAKFPVAQQILKLAHEEGRKKVNREINIEQLLTRLYSGMPYDSQTGTNDQIKMLRADVLECLLNKLNMIREGTLCSKELELVAKHCIENKITCITFNYDSIFDEALNEFKYDGAGPGEEWNPEDGYGFFCKPLRSLFQVGEVYSGDGSVMNLLKLHGSVNWFIKTGYQSPYFPDAIVHREDWYNSTNEKYLNEDKFVVREPFIIPPVLMKSEITEQPLIRAIWQIAYEQLEMADSVTFVGYSLPVTDIAARFLFRESLASGKAKQIKVIDVIDKPAPQERLISQYKSILPDLTEKLFDFGGALKWANRYCQ